MLSDQKTKLVCTRRVEFNINNKWKYGSVDKIIAISNKVKEVLVKDGIPENRISVVFSGIDLNRFENISTDYLYKEFNVKEGNTIIGTVGSLDYHKNHKGFIQAASLIKKSIPDAVFFIVGKGCLEKELKEYAKKLNLSDSIIFTGFRNDIPQILSIFDIFVLSSYTEGLCTSLIDAMAVGLPIIATNVGGVPELIAENINGFQVLPDNPAQIYEAVMKLVKDRNLLNRFSELNKIKAKEFSKDRMIENTEHVYWEMI